MPTPIESAVAELLGIVSDAQADALAAAIKRLRAAMLPPAPAPAPETWETVTSEGGTFPLTMSPLTRTRYGLNGFWIYLDLPPGIHKAGLDLYQHDPIYGFVKIVQKSNVAPTGPLPPNTFDPDHPVPGAPPPAPVPPPPPAPTPPSPAPGPVPPPGPAVELPAYIASMPMLQWGEVPNSRMSDLQRAVVVQPGFPSSIIDAWSGASMDQDTCTLRWGPNGGHGDYAGNEINALKLDVEVPRMIEACPASEQRFVINGSPFYLDKRGACAHTYWAMHYIHRLKRHVLMCRGGMSGSFPMPPADWPYANEDNWSRSFNVVANDYDPPEFIARNPYPVGTDVALCFIHPVTEDIYLSCQYNNAAGWMVWRCATNTWERLSNQSGAPWYKAACVDPETDRVLLIGNDYGGRPGLSDLTGNGVPAEFTGLGADGLHAENYPGCVYDGTNKQWIAVHNRDGVIELATCSTATLNVQLPPVTGPKPTAKTHGICGAAHFVKKLGIVVIANKWDENVKFIRVAQPAAGAAAPAPVPVPPPPPAPTPPAPAPVPTPPAGKMTVPALVAGGPPDFVSAADILAPVPWYTFADHLQTVAFSLRGVEPKYWDRRHVFDHQNVLYQPTAAVVGDHIEQVHGQFGEDPTEILRRLATYPLRGGPRGRHIMTPYCAWHGHTRRRVDGTLATDSGVPMWVGIVMSGEMVFLFRDGSAAIPFKVPLESYAFDFTYHEPREANTFFVVDTGAGRVLSVNRRTQVTTELCRGFRRATSIRSVGGMLYVCDPDAGQVVEVDPVDGTKRKVCDLPHAFWVDHFSNGDLCVMTEESAIHRVDRVTGAIGPDMNNDHKLSSWVQCDVDRHGTCGEVDAICALRAFGIANTDFWRFTSRGQAGFSDGFGVASVGNTRWTRDSTGHYPWSANHHPDDACLLVQGFANAQPMLICAHDALLPDEYDHALMGDGWHVLNREAAGVPPLSTLLNLQGGSQLCSADAIAEMSFSDQAAFVRRGLCGSYPRDIAGRDMLALLYFINRDSQRYLAEGPAHIERLRAFAA